MYDPQVGPRPRSLAPSLFDAFDPQVVFEHLLGEVPNDPSGVWADQFRAARPEEWLKGWTHLEYLYLGLARELSERGGTAEAALSIRLDLQEGRIRAVVIDDHDGEAHPIPPERWRAPKGSPDMFWTGRADLTADGRRFVGNIYLISAAEPEAALAPKTKPLDLSDSDALCKLVLHLVGKKTAAQIANSSTGTENAVPERTVSHLIKKAREQQAENAK